MSGKPPGKSTARKPAKGVEVSYYTHKSSRGTSVRTKTVKKRRTINDAHGVNCGSSSQIQSRGVDNGKGVDHGNTFGNAEGMDYTPDDDQPKRHGKVSVFLRSQMYAETKTAHRVKTTCFGNGRAGDTHGSRC